MPPRWMPQRALRSAGRSYRLRRVAVRDPGLITRGGKILPDLIGDHHGPVMAARAAEADSEIALAFVNVVRQKVIQQIRDAGDELAGLRERPDVFRDGRILPRQLFEFRDVIRVRKEPHVEHQVAVGWESVPEAETRDVNEDARFVFVARELLPDEMPQIVNVELGSVDNQIGQRPNGREHSTFLFNAVTDLFLTSAEGMRAPRLAEAAANGFIRGLEEDQSRVDILADPAKSGRKLRQTRAFADIDNQRRASRRRGIADQFGELRNQVDGKIIDSVITLILKGA